MNFENFVSLVKIDEIPNTNNFGHHPMNLAAINKDGTLELNALLHQSLVEIRARVRYYLNKESSSIMLSLDFPKNEIYVNDFVMIVSLENNEFSNVVIKEYEISTGKILSTSSGVKNDFVDYILNYLIE